jgi:hypothetical protein
MSGPKGIGIGAGEGTLGGLEFGRDRLMRERIGTTLTMITTSRAGRSMRVTGTMKITATITIGDVGS